MIVANFYPFVYQSVLCSHFEPQFRFLLKQKLWMAKDRFKVLRCPIFVQRNDKKLSMGCKNIRENQGYMSMTSLKISWKIRGLFPKIVVATLPSILAKCGHHHYRQKIFNHFHPIIHESALHQALYNHCQVEHCLPLHPVFAQHRLVGSSTLLLPLGLLWFSW